MLKKYKCSKCETTGEAVSDTRLACPVCGAEMLHIEEGQELRTEQAKVDNLPVAKVVSLGFFDLLPIPAGSKLDIFRQKLQTTKLVGSIQTKDNSLAFKRLSEITYNPINDDIPGNYKKQRTRQIIFYLSLGVIFFLLLILFLCLI